MEKEKISHSPYILLEEQHIRIEALRAVATITAGSLSRKLSIFRRIKFIDDSGEEQILSDWIIDFADELTSWIKEGKK